MNKQLHLYREMLRIRRVEEAIAGRYKEQQMRCPTHLSIGQEATPVALSDYLTAEDKAFSSHRAHAHYLAKGGCLNKLIAELYGKVTGCTAGRGGSMHLSDLDSGFVASTAIVGNSIPLAVGYGLHLKTTKKPGVSVAYFGDGAVEEGAFYESANFAVLKKLPVLFICENNFYSVYSNMACRQPPSRKISDLATGIGLRSQAMDGNDVYAMHNTFADLVNSVRNLEGPVFLECFTYRHREHCGPNFDDDLGYRPPAEVSQWLADDPLSKAQLALTRLGIKVDQKALEAEIDKDIDAAFDSALAADFGDAEHNNQYLYAE